MPGDVIEVYDLKQRLRCIIKATKVYIIEFGNIPEEVWRGETFSGAEEFRECHIRCMPHVDLHDRFELVTLYFELVEVISREDDNSKSFWRDVGRRVGFGANFGVCIGNSFRAPSAPELLSLCVATCTQERARTAKLARRAQGRMPGVKRKITKEKGHPAWRLPGSCPASS